MSRPRQTPDYATLLRRAYDTIAALEDRVTRVERSQREPIAIVGVGLRLPGGISDPESFWRFLSEGGDAITQVPPDRWDIDKYFDTDPDAAGKMYTRWGGFLKDVDQFDARHFGISPREAASMDPQQRLLLESSWEALERAGYATPDTPGRRTGVFVGMVATDYGVLTRADLRLMDGHLGTGISRSIAAGRLAYAFGLRGPNMAIDTACSSSSVATHLALLSLRAGECDMALAGGVNLILAPDGTISASRGRMMSPTGRCHTFDAAADGYVRAEGCVMFVLKRLADAVAAGDSIMAVIIGSAVNQDGRSNGMTAPNGRAQEELLRTAIADAGIGPAEVSYVEAHGTGTSLGDPIEVRALGSAFGTSHSREHPLMIGSVKTNLGHLEAAAGSVGMLKLVLAMQHGTIPPHLHLRQLNPHLSWESLPIAVPTTPTPWRPPNGRRIGGVSSFGFSGTNSHLILAEPPATRPAERTVDHAHVVTLSGRNADSLGQLTRSLADACASAPAHALRDIAFTLNTGRTHQSERLAIVASSTDDLAAKLTAAAEDSGTAIRGTAARRPDVAFLFTGQGAQWPGMGRSLFESGGAPVFRRVLEACAAGVDEARASLVAEGIGPGPVEPLLEVMFAAPETPEASLLDQTGYTQPALFALELALAEQWQAWGIRPAAVIGHSVGELVAATVAGIIPRDAALRLVTARGLVLQRLPVDGPGAGGMVSVTAGEAEVATVLQSLDADVRRAVSIAAVNAPRRVVIAGTHEALGAATAALATAGFATQPLRVSHAFHSPQVDPAVEVFERIAREISFGPAQIPIVSNVTGGVAASNIATAGYWARHIRAAVRFADGLQAVTGIGCDVMLEVGPKPTLLGLAQEQSPANGPAPTMLPSLRPGRDELVQMLEGLAALFVQGVEIDWRAVESTGEPRRIPLPTTVFQRQRYWLPFPDVNGGPGARPVEHPLLHERLRSRRLEGMVFQSEVGIASPAYLADHRIDDLPLFPAAGYAEMAAAAGRRVLGAPAVLDRMQIRDALVLPDSGSVTLQLLLRAGDGGRQEFEVCSLSADDGEEWTVHAAGTLRVSDAGPPPVTDTLEDARSRCLDAYPVELFYERLAAVGATYGPAFRGVREIWRTSGEAVAHIELPPDLSHEAAEYELHPALLDACIQLLGAAHPDAERDEGGDVHVPVGLDLGAIRQPGVSSLWCHAVVSERAADSPILTGALRMFSSGGTLIAEVGAVQLRRLTGDVRQRLRRSVPDQRMGEWLHSLEWEPRPVADVQDVRMTGRWLILGDHQGIGAAIADRIVQAGAQVTRFCGGADAAESAALAIVAASGAGEQVAGIVHLGGLTASAEPELDPLEAQHGTSGAVLALVQSITRTAHPVGGMWLVTRGAQFVPGRQAVVAPAQAPIWGLANTIAVEHPELNCRCVDLDPGAMPDPAGVLLAELLANDEENRIAWRAGSRFAARLARTPEPPQPSDDAVALDITERGMLDNLVVRRTARGTPGAGEVEVAVHATGLNFRDVLNALGMYPGPAGPPGNECSGVVVAVGTDVTNIAIGDEVMATGSGTFGSHVVTSARSVYRKPRNLTHAQASSIPIAFLTAHYGLHVLAGIKRGDRVLVHAAAGGVGLAAVQLAQAAGAEVIGSAGSAQKHAFLRSIGVTQVISSRDPDFRDEVMRATDGQGVDIVLNSLADEFIPRSLEVLADGGCFLEIGKRGVWTPDRVRALNPTLRYHVYDLADVLIPRPEYATEVFDELVPEFESGSLWPLPLQVFPLEEVADAFRFMAQAKHTGKIVVVQEQRSRQPVAVREDRSYLVTGGLTGIGLRAAEWLVARGARHLVLMGRRAPSDEARAALKAMGAQDVAIRLFAGDVAETDDVDRVFSEIEREMPRLGGIIHSAGVLDDGVLAQQSMARFETVMRPKIRGAWNLHRRSLASGSALDFFVLFSTGSVHLGAAGQGNYAAANAFLDALAHFRRSHGLHALAINWGAWSGVGMTTTLDDRDHRRWRAAGLQLIAPEEGIRALERTLALPGGQVAVLPIEWSKYLQREQAQVPRILERLASRANGAGRPSSSPSGTSRDSGMLDKLRAADPDVAREMLWVYVRDLVVRVLALDPHQPLEPSQGLTELGMDSLMAVELSNHLQATLGVRLSSTLAFEYPTLAALNDFLATSVLPQQQVVAAASTNGHAPLPPAPAAAESSDDDVQTTLMRELERAGY